MTYDEAQYMAYSMLTAQEWWRLKLQTTPVGDLPIFVKREISGTFVDERAEIGARTIIFPNCVIAGRVTIGKNCVIMPGSALIGEEITKEEKAKGKMEMRLGSGCLVYPHTTLLNVEAGDGVTLGLPHQKNSKIGNGTVIGALAELNRSVLGKNVKDVHHSYLGDATVGDDSNIGAGTITANYDGKNKHKTVFGPNCSTGINTNIIAPNEFPEGTSIAAGSVVLANLKNMMNIPPFSWIFSLVLKTIVVPKENAEK